MRSVTLIFFIFLLYSVVDGRGDCVVTSKSPRQPVYIGENSGKYELLIPTVNGILLQQGEKITLLCAGHLNRLNQTNTNITAAVCVGGDKFLILNRVHKFSDLECRRDVRASVIHTDTACANGFLSHIGYHIRDQFLALIEVCFDGDQANTFYTKHWLLTPDLKEFYTPYTKPTFNTKGLSPDNKSVSIVYYIDAQKARLSSLLQSSILATNYITNNSYLTRGHLSPEDDFALVTWKYSTYFFLNACPIWQSIQMGNWKLVENIARKLRNSLDENLQIITGTHEVLELADRSGSPKPLYLSQRGKKFPVPMYIWKIVYSEKFKKAIVLVVYNNPYELTAKNLCSCICKAHGWYSEKWSNIKKGFVQCCSYSQFKQFVRNIPSLTVTGILPGPE